jgi:hypothetical protein
VTVADTISTDGPSYSLAEFCALEKICQATFYKIDIAVRPKLTLIPGTNVRIITSAERARYHARLAKWQTDHADELEAERRRRADHFSLLGKRGAASPKHYCRRGAKKRRSASKTAAA